MNQNEGISPLEMKKREEASNEIKKPANNEIEKALYSHKADPGAQPNGFMPIRPETAQSSRPSTSFGMNNNSSQEMDYLIIDRPETGMSRPDTSNGNAIDRPATSSGKSVLF